MAKPTSLIKPYLKKLTLQVHPDFFHGDSIKKQHNANMLQQLNSILDPILRPGTSAVTEPMRLTFYNKRIQQRRKAPSIIPGVVFSSPKQTWPTIQTFLSLCQQLDIKILPSDQDLVESMIRQTTMKKKSPPRSLQQEFAEALYKEQVQKKNPIQLTPAMVLSQPFFMCDDSLDRQRVADKMAQWLPQLYPDQWWGRLPTLFLASSRTLDDEAKGVLVLNDAMDLQEMKTFIRLTVKTKLKEYQDQDQ